MRAVECRTEINSSTTYPLTSTHTHPRTVPRAKRIVYVTRSDNVEENEDVIERVLEETSADLVALTKNDLQLSDFTNASDYDDCFRADPSLHGDGVFIACVKPGKDASEDVRDGEDDGDAIEVVSERMDDMALLEASTDKKKKRRVRKNDKKKNRRSRKRSQYWMPTLASQRRSVSTAGLGAMDNGTSRKTSTQSEQALNVNAHVNDPLANSAAHVPSLVSLTVFGTRLQDYYAQMMAPATNGEAKGCTTTPEVRRWSYPVPNPTKWR